MTLQTGVILFAALINFFTLLGVALSLGQPLAVLKALTSTVEKIDRNVDQHTQAIASMVAELADVVRRVDRLERLEDAR